ncbi:MAG: hypothetical protein AAFV29_25240, partial [Myxococcota bacterium]
MKRQGCLVLLAAMLGVATAAGCAGSATSGDKLETLRRSVKAYNEAYRWKNFERAASFLPRDLRMSFVATYEEDEKSLHIEDYQILQVRVLNEKAADVEVRVIYMMLPSVVVKNRRMTQHWRKIGARWTLETEENSIRDIQADARPQDPDAFGGGDDVESGNGGSSVYAT